MAKCGRPPKQNPLDLKDDVFVKGKTIRKLFDSPISSSTLHRWVEEGKVIKHSHKFDRLNATRKAMGLPEEDVASYKQAARPTKVNLAILALSFIREEVKWTPLVGRIRWGRRGQTRGACMMCMGMIGNGRVVGLGKFGLV